MAKRDPNGPGARLEEVHRLLCRGTGRMATMLAMWKMDVDAIVEIEADVQRAAAAMRDFKNFMVELKQRRDAAQQETSNANSRNDGGDSAATDGSGDSVSADGASKRARKTRGRKPLHGNDASDGG